MNYVEEWKKEELDWSLKYYEDLLKQYNQVLEDTKMSCSYHNDRYYFINTKGMSEEECRNESKRLYEIEKSFKMEHKGALATMEKFIVRDRDNCGYETYATTIDNDGYKREYKCYKSQYKLDEEKAIEVLTKLIDKHFETLQAKVEKKIGKIIKIESLGGSDYSFIGELDKCNVEVILAGGYNVQRLHTRWIITKNLDR